MGLMAWLAPGAKRAVDSSLSRKELNMARYLISLRSVIVWLLLCGAALAAQTESTLTGTVTDQNGASVAGAQVQILNIASGRALTTRTDSAGHYELTKLAAGSYQMSVSVAGFATVTRRITLGGAAASLTEDFLLVPGIIESNITVTAGKGSARIVTETPQAITVTDTLQIEERRPASTLQAIERAPNLTPVTANSALERPRLRGLASNRLLIILDGERLNNARTDPTTGVSPSIVDVTQLESAEVLGGAGSSLYGSDAVAGIINLITRSPIRSDGAQILGLRFDGDFRTQGRFRRGSASLNWSLPKLAFRLSGSLFRQGNYHSGSGDIPLEEVVRLGEFATSLGNASGASVARTFAVWSLPSGAEIPNGQAHGFNDQLDAWFFPGTNQSLRYRQLNSQHKDLGFAFIAPPFDQRTQTNGFRRLDKYGLRYEGRELKTWMPRVAAGFYRQKYSYPDDTLTSPINPGSSWKFIPNPGAPQSPLAVLTGNPSTFSDANYTDNKNSISTWAFDAQATLAPFNGLLLTTGIGYLRDSSADQFARVEFVPGTQAPLHSISGRASNPDSVYRNWGWFNLLEYEPVRWLRLAGGLRVDNWRTEARATRGFPLGSEAAILEASLPGLIASPGQINTEGAGLLADLLSGVGGIQTTRTVITGNAGFVLRLPHGINPYFRWGTSYREPGITERYLLRDFGDPTFSILVIPNTALKPERGQTFDAGLKIERARWNASLAFFRNNLKDFIGNAFADPLFVPADPARGLNGISPFFPFHGVVYVQRANIARARTQGLEATFETSLPVGTRGIVTPFSSLGWLKGSNLTPDEDTLNLIGQFYNRTDTPLPLRGSAEDAPLTGITPFRTISGLRYDSPRRRWFTEYEVRYQSRVRRVDPLDLTTAISTQYGSLASLDSLIRHTARAGYTLGKEDYRASFTFGVENLTNRLYFEQFQTAPAPGRSLVFGMTLELFDLLRK
jgi:hemoglobin/transferrin/lactoferrin receptor protein